MEKNEKYILIFSVVLIVLVSFTSVGILYSAFSGKTPLVQDAENYYFVVIPILVIMLVILVVCIITIAAIILKNYFMPAKEKDVLELTPDDISAMTREQQGFLLQRLKEKKERTEYLIHLAEEKYHTRKLDSESFREIVRDHQKEIMEIEARIKELEDRLQELKK